MRNYEIIKAIYDRCPDGRDHPYTVDQYFDRCQDIIDMIEKERPEFRKNFWEGGYIKKNHWPQQDAGIDYQKALLKLKK